MHIFADENMPLVKDFFSRFGQVTLFNGRTVQPHQLKDADVLLVRSVTAVNTQLLAENTRLRFVGTATIGTEHIDQALLAKRNIAFSSAPGCNAQSVVEYVLSSLWYLAEKYQWSLQKKIIGIVGVGNIGNKLALALTALNIELLLCDPLRAHEPGFKHTDFNSICQQADIISFHTPLVSSGESPTRHMLNMRTLALLKPTCAIINASRGGVIDNQALLTHLSAGNVHPLVLDVWENEPQILTDLLQHTDIATAHIAGHSVEGKARGTEMLYQQWCKLINEPAEQSLATLLTPGTITKVEISPNFGLPDVQNLARVLYDVRRDDALLRVHLQRHGFDWLRKSYPPRREFSSLQVSGPAVPEWLIKLGFRQAG